MAGFKLRATAENRREVTVPRRSRYMYAVASAASSTRGARAQEKQEEKVGESASQVSIAGISAARFEYVLNVKHEIDTWLSVCRDPHLDSTNV